MSNKQDPEHCAHKRHPLELDRLKQHIEHFTKVGDPAEAARFSALHKNTEDRAGHATKAADLVDKLGLSHDVTPHSVTYNDAVNYVAKVLHEMQHGVTKSHYARAHYHVKDANGGAHCDEKLLNTPRDACAEVIEHLGLTDAAHVAAVKEFFGKAAE